LLNLTQPARVYVHASLSYTWPGGGTAKDANCNVRDEKGGTIGHDSVYLRPAGAEDASASFTEVGTLPAGTHDVQIWCYSYGSPGQVAIQNAGMTVFAVAQG
jgi:hypothetical protein